MLIFKSFLLTVTLATLSYMFIAKNQSVMVLDNYTQSVTRVMSFEPSFSSVSKEGKKMEVTMEYEWGKGFFKTQQPTQLKGYIDKLDYISYLKQGSHLAKPKYLNKHLCAKLSKLVEYSACPLNIVQVSYLDK